MAWKLRDILVEAAKKEGIEVTEDYKIKDTSKPKVSKLYVEKEQDTLYLYDHEEKEFVCQAKSMEELAKLALQYKKIKYAAVIDGEQTFMFVDGAVKQHL
jgi:hypothetical protein